MERVHFDENGNRHYYRTEDKNIKEDKMDEIRSNCYQSIIISLVAIAISVVALVINVVFG